jgi:Ca-activated chloride channel family protein
MKKEVHGSRFTVHGWASTLLITLLLLTSNVFAQSERKLVREGNKLYMEKKFTDAEVNYKKSLNVNKESPPAKFNLGDAYYKQDKYEDAASQFNMIATDKNLSKQQQSQAYHNLGNSLLKAKKYDESINSYKNALKLNPKDNDTRYNLAYAQAMLQQQQQKQQQQNKNDQKKDQKKEQQQKQDQKKDQQKNDEQKQAQQQKQKISKEDAEKMLQALNNDEKNAQKKLARKQATRIQIDKQW